MTPWTRVALTGLVGGDVNGGVVGRPGVFPRNPVDRLHLEAVAGVGLQVADHHLPLTETQPPGRHVHVVVAARARAPVAKALFTHHVVDQVAAPASVLRLLPLQ